jgi:hypothetical protein
MSEELSFSISGLKCREQRPQNPWFNGFQSVFSKLFDTEGSGHKKGMIIP